MDERTAVTVGHVDVMPEIPKANKEATTKHVEVRPDFSSIKPDSREDEYTKTNTLTSTTKLKSEEGAITTTVTSIPQKVSFSHGKDKRQFMQPIRQFRMVSDGGNLQRPPRIYDANVFTFKPKVSPQSVKIAQSLGTDFMSRQQIHLEKQRRYFEQAALQFKSPSLYGRLSPVNRSRKSKEQVIVREIFDMPEDPKYGQTDSVPNLVSKSECSSSILLNSDPGALASRSSPSLAPIKPHPPNTPKSRSLLQVNISQDEEDVNNNCEDPENLSASRSKTGPTQTSTSKTNLTARKLSNIVPINLDRFKNAKIFAEKCIKTKKVFTIQGPYPAIREGLRQRGWVEKFYKLHMGPPPKKSPRITKKKTVCDSDNDNDDDDDDDDDDGNATDDDDDEPDKVPPWEEEQGIYGIMSRTVRNVPPTFIWCVRRDAVDCKSLRKDQVINHYGKANFTTKVGLCMNLRNTPWFEPEDQDDFFPRCYRLSHDEEKQSFIEDYRLTMCINIMKWVVEAPHESLSAEALESSEASPAADEILTSPRKMVLPPIGESITPTTSSLDNNNQPKKKKGGIVPSRVINQAVEQCEKFITQRNHKDIDQTEERSIFSEAEWDELLQNYYKLVFEDGCIPGAEERIPEAEVILANVQKIWPQFKMDGLKNIWIVKPGAKSRGRGIICYDRLEDMLKLVSSTVVKKDSKFVVQKYIERPLLIYNTKFDIRQWFLVTDWNPLTLWFYKDSYLRFCSQQFTLEDFNESIHLSNNAIQKYYYNGPRSSKLPEDNMWSSNDFKDWLRERGLENIYDNVIYPGMKKAVLCSLLSTQDVVEYRKSAFELYGADFMLTEDYQPWLIEINSSPSMSYSTKVTADMCAAVLEDSIKVVIDRRWDKNADTGLFELAYRQPLVTVPPYIGINLTVEGSTIRRPGWMGAKRDENIVSKSNFTPRPPPPPLAPVSTHERLASKTSESSAQDTSCRASQSMERTFNLSHKTGPTAKSGAGGGASSAPPVLPTPATRAPSPPKLQLTSINLHTLPEPIMPEPTAAVSDGLWGSTCKNCGSGANLKLDLAAQQAQSRCWCQQDSVRMDPTFGARQPTFPFQRVAPPLATSYSIPTSLHNSTQEPLGPIITPSGRVLNLPKRFQVDRNKLMASVYAKTGTSPTPPNSALGKTMERIVLRYTDGGIQKPEFTTRITPPSHQSFPKVISRYVSRKSGSNGLSLYTETCKPNPKLSVVTQTFI